MELGRLKVNGNSYDPSKSYTKDELSGYTAFSAFTGSVKEPYENIDTIKNWNAYGNRTDLDYKKWRDEIKDIVKNDYGDGSVEQGFTALTSTQKEIAAKNKVGTHDQRLNTLGFDNMVLSGLNYHSKVSSNRQTRFGYGVAYVWNALGDEGGRDVMNDVITSGNNMYITYVTFGVEGTEEGDSLEGIADYLYGRSGTTFENTGLKDKNYDPDGFSGMTGLADKVYDILINGNY